MDKKFDKEYSTQWIKEVKWLSCHNVRFTFVKRDTNGITIYKYKKHINYFLHLQNFIVEMEIDIVVIELNNEIENKILELFDKGLNIKNINSEKIVENFKK